MNNLYKLARKPYKGLEKQFIHLYQTFDELRSESLARLPPAVVDEAAKQKRPNLNGGGGSEVTVDEDSMDTGEKKDDQIENEPNSHKNDANANNDDEKLDENDADNEAKGEAVVVID